MRKIGQQIYPLPQDRVEDLVSDLAGTQELLTSGSNIKTINGSSILGSGDLVVSGGVSDGDKGDITVTASGATWTIDNGVVTAAKTSITETPDGTKYLRDDFSWQAVTGGLSQAQILARISIGF